MKTHDALRFFPVFIGKNWDEKEVLFFWFQVQLVVVPVLEVFHFVLAFGA